MANTFDRRRFNTKGGDWQLRQIDPTPGSFFSIGSTKSTKVSNAENVAEFIDEVGRYLGMVDAGGKLTLTLELLQSSVDEIGLVKNAAGIFYEAYYKIT